VIGKTKVSQLEYSEELESNNLCTDESEEELQVADDHHSIKQAFDSLCGFAFFIIVINSWFT
jgi:hypothetical protein